MRFRRRTVVTMLSAGLFLAIAAVYGVRPAVAGPPAQATGNEGCLACHGQPGMIATLPSGEKLYLTVDPQVYAKSVHGQKGQACLDCHPDVDVSAHPKGEAAWAGLGVATRRDLSIHLYRDACVQCHPNEYDANLDSVHGKGLAAGDTNSAICTDCHGTHNITVPGQPRSRDSLMCELCHAEIYERYKQSVHGAALLGEGNADVPGCVDCHRVHSVQGPSSGGSFHLFSPEVCAKCHADKELMGRYGLSADVFRTYVSDFHGTTVELFQKTAPDQETNKPVCIDCHGVHDMKKVDDPESTVIKANLLKTCQKCHPDATDNFPTSWIRHYRPSVTKAPLVYFVNLFYLIFIPAVLAVMLLFVVTDAYRRIFRRKKEDLHGNAA
jgi:Doubled CXXCH motif (Paired_CXXCH_1)